MGVLKRGEWIGQRRLQSVSGEVGFLCVERVSRIQAPSSSVLGVSVCTGDLFFVLASDGMFVSLEGVERRPIFFFIVVTVFFFHERLTKKHTYIQYFRVCRA